MAVEIGDYVQVVNRVSTSADQKSGLFYNHFRNLCGVVDRIYQDGAICVVVDHATLSPEMMARLKRAERLIKPRWKTAASPDGGTTETTAQTEGRTTETGASEGEGAEEGSAEEAEPLDGAEAAAEDLAEEDIRNTPGLRYAIVLKVEDVGVLSAGERQAARSAAREAGGAIRASEAEIKAAEQRFMENLVNRAQNQS